jgi:hypothetical protein
MPKRGQAPAAPLCRRGWTLPADSFDPSDPTNFSGATAYGATAYTSSAISAAEAASGGVSHAERCRVLHVESSALGRLVQQRAGERVQLGDHRDQGDELDPTLGVVEGCMGNRGRLTTSRPRLFAGPPPEDLRLKSNSRRLRKASARFFRVQDSTRDGSQSLDFTGRGSRPSTKVSRPRSSLFGLLRHDKTRCAITQSGMRAFSETGKVEEI